MKAHIFAGDARKSVDLSVATVEQLFGERAATASPSAAFREQGVYRRCVTIRAGALAAMPWQLTRLGSEKPVWSSRESVPPKELGFLRNLPRLLWLWEASLATMGRAYALPIFPGTATPERVVYLSPLSMQEVYQPGVGIRYVQRTVGERSTEDSTMRYAPEDLLLFYQPDPFAEAGPGASDGGAAARAASALAALERFVDEHMARGLLKGTLLLVPPTTPAPERERLESWWRRFFAGARGAGAQKVLNADAVQVQTIGEGIKDLDLEKGRGALVAGICQGLGVPQSLVMSQAANYATASVELASLYLLTVVPQAQTVISPALNEQLLRPLGYEITFLSDEVEALQRMELDKAAGLQALAGRPLMSANEARATLGFDPVPGGDMLAASPGAAAAEGQALAKSLAGADEAAFGALLNLLKA